MLSSYGRKKPVQGCVKAPHATAICPVMDLRYLPKRGTASEVGGMISASRRKKTVSERRIEMHRVT